MPSPRHGSLALLQWVSDPLVLRKLAARASDSHLSLHDLCLPETGLAWLSCTLKNVVDGKRCIFGDGQSVSGGKLRANITMSTAGHLTRAPRRGRATPPASCPRDHDMWGTRPVGGQRLPSSSTRSSHSCMRAWQSPSCSIFTK